MNVGWLGAVIQVSAIAAGAPLVAGVMRQTRARLEGRAGAGWRQPWLDLRKLFGKQRLRPDGTTVVFTATPMVVIATTLTITAIVPLVSVASPLDQVGDLFAVVGLLLLGTVSLALAGLDTGTAFGGMGASRATTIIALVEPSLLLAIFALSLPARTSNLAAIVSLVANDPAKAATPASALAAVALAVVILAETGRLPVDNPTTHLELTMIHEAMILEYSGPDLALIEWSAAMRLSVLLGLFANLFAPFGVATATSGAGGLALATIAIGVKVLALAVGLAVGEVFLAKLRLFRVPELLAGSFVLGLLAVTASYFLTSPAGTGPA